MNDLAMVEALQARVHAAETDAAEKKVELAIARRNVRALKAAVEELQEALRQVAAPKA